MPNPRPKLENLKPFKPRGEQAMSGRLFVRVTSDIEQAVKALPDSPAWLRRVITTAAKRELMGESPDGGKHKAAEVLEVVNDLLAMPRLSGRVREGLTKIKTYLEESHD